MAEDNLGLHIDDDWKRQAQEEKRRLEEEERKRREQDEAARQSAAPAVVPGAPAGAAATGARGSGRRGGAREMPPASFGMLVRSIATQALFYLGDLSTGGGEQVMNLDMAKHQLDTLAVLEDKTQGNLSPEEQQFIDMSLYETRMRFISVAGQIIAGRD